MPVETILWRDGRLDIVDQTLLPEEHRRIALDTAAEVWQAIHSLQVRGAPAIGIAAAFGVLVALKEHRPADTPSLLRVVNETADYLSNSRPTAVNLFWALKRMRTVAAALSPTLSVDAATGILEREALLIFEEDRATCRKIGEHGATLISDGDGILTHCNAGALATADYGTALAGIYRASEQGKTFKVYADETRPLLQGARLTAWELSQAGIPVTVICDSMAAQVMREGRINLVVVGADRIAANGDVANKIGTYGLALLAKAHEIPFYVAAPLSTFDFSLETGDEIPIEQRDPLEICDGFGRRTVPHGVEVYNPAFDVTPAALIEGWITERGIHQTPFPPSFRDGRLDP